jgi:hypothetical protein
MGTFPRWLLRKLFFSGKFPDLEERELGDLTMGDDGRWCPRYSAKYLDDLFTSDQYENLVQISSLLCACDRFAAAEPDYGLPTPLFVFVQGLLWFAQSARSGTWTYYEATPVTRQNAMLSALQTVGAVSVAAQYAEGMLHWRDEARMKTLDDWLQNHDTANTQWLRQLVCANREAVEKLVS